MKPYEKNPVDRVAVVKVAVALACQNPSAAIGDCKTTEVRNVSELLVKVSFLEQMQPGLVDEFFNDAISHFHEKGYRETLEAEAQRRADEEGFGKEWASAINAGLSPKKTGHRAAMVAVVMAAKKCTEDQAIRETAEHYGIDEESVRRSIRRRRAVSADKKKKSP